MAGPSRTDLLKEATDLNVEVPSAATKPQIQALIDGERERLASIQTDPTPRAPADNPLAVVDFPADTAGDSEAERLAAADAALAAGRSQDPGAADGADHPFGDDGDDEEREIERRGVASWWCPFCDHSHTDYIDVCVGCGALRAGDTVRLDPPSADPEPLSDADVKKRARRRGADS